ncbi:MmcB family DNA repair protein [uncultured Bartonella sp.]|uniref:MmcB family DNA repair protein n=1 Tax=uncultured Bartonella sp. TaxID=104108 RepID=UPI0025FE7CEB|nr:MmcB family DNA repair protein [uncultured Bartonella sp.]
MPIINLHKEHPLDDGRQSEKALMVRHGVQRLFLRLGIPVLSELPLADGRRADLVGITRKGEVIIVEIKSSVGDLKADHKWPDYRIHCDRLYFASHNEVPMELFPEDCGFILADGFDGYIMREAPEHRMPAATRKAVMLRFSRVAARRLTRAELEGFDLEGDDDEKAG